MQISLASGAVVLDAGPLLEPPVPPLVRLPVVRDAGPLLEPLVPPLVRLRAGDPAMSYKRCASNSVIFALFALICPLRIFGRGTGPRKTDKILMKHVNFQQSIFRACAWHRKFAITQKCQFAVKCDFTDSPQGNTCFCFLCIVHFIFWSGV